MWNRLFLLFVTYVLDHPLEVIDLGSFIPIKTSNTLKCCSQIILPGHVPRLANRLGGHQDFLVDVWESLRRVYYEALVMHKVFLLTILCRFFSFAQDCSC